MSDAPQIQSKTASAIRNVAADFSACLDAGELLTGTPTVQDTTSPEELTIANIAVSTAQLTINGVTVPIGEAVQFKVSGGTANTIYTIQIVVSTDATPAQTLYKLIQLEIKPDA